MQHWYKEVKRYKKLSLNGRNTSRIRYLPPAFSPSPQIPSHPLQLLSSAIRHIESLGFYIANLSLRDLIFVFLYFCPILETCMHKYGTSMHKYGILFFAIFKINSIFSFLAFSGFALTQPNLCAID